MWQDRGGNAYSVAVVMAAANESQTIGSVIDGVKKLSIADSLILVDDGSTDDTALIAGNLGCKVLRNDTRIGQTRSLRRGISASTTDLVITIDADMDHMPSDIPKLLSSLDSQRADVVIGRRNRLPRTSEKIMSLMLRNITGINDTISGFRIITRRALEKVEFDNDNTWGVLFLIKCAKKGLRIVEVPVETPPARQNARTGGKIRSNIKILKALGKGLLCAASPV
jgi:glycosyltransferase involved in cell wall biosynthesis